MMVCCRTLGFLCHKAQVTSAAFSPDVSRVLTASRDNPSRVWHLRMLESGEGFAIGCARLGNNTDLAEVRQRYGLGELAPICGDHPPVPVNWQELK